MNRKTLIILNLLIIVGGIALIVYSWMYGSVSDGKIVLGAIVVINRIAKNVESIKLSLRNFDESIKTQEFLETVEGAFVGRPKQYKKLLNAIRSASHEYYKLSYNKLLKLKDECETGSDYAAVAFWMARSCQDRGKTDSAINFFRESIKYRPEFARAKANVAEIYLDEHEYKKAINWYKRVLEDKEEYMDAYVGMMWAYLNECQYDKVVETADVAQKYDMKSDEKMIIAKVAYCAYQLLGEEIKADQQKEVYVDNGGDLDDLEELFESCTE